MKLIRILTVGILISLDKEYIVCIAETAVYNKKYPFWAENARDWWSTYYLFVKNKTLLN
jgi:hypothetical protein